MEGLEVVTFTHRDRHLPMPSSPIVRRFPPANSLAAGAVSLIGLAMLALVAVSPVAAQDAPEADVPAATPDVGWRVRVALPLDAAGVERIVAELTAIAGGETGPGLPRGDRRTVVLEWDADDNDGAATEFEEALRLARAIAKPALRPLRVVGFVRGSLRGHAVLPLLSCDALFVHPAASIGDAAISERGADGDESIVASYRAIAARRALFAPAVAEALVRPSLELVQATTLDGKRRFVSGEELIELRRQGEGWREDVWAAAGEPLVIAAARLRDSRIATQSVESIDQVRRSLELAELKSVGESMIGAAAVGTLLDINGVISTDRVRRWELNLINSAEKGAVNMWVVSIDSPGGNLGGSVQLAGTLSTVAPPIRRVVGYVSGQTLGDASVIAVACRPLYIHPDSRLGGPGAKFIRSDDLDDLGAAIERIAVDASRPLAIVRGLLDPSLEVHRYTHRRTGEVRYATGEEFESAAEEADADVWQRGDRLDLSEGLSATEAVELGLAEGVADSLNEVAGLVGLAEVPAPLAPRGVIHFVEWLGSLTGVAVFLLLVGLMTLSIEVGAPGLSFPGFISMLCFSLYFWIQFLNGTAEWLEILAFALGVICIGIEIFLLPGVGVFGIGGLCLLVLGVVLTSQTFVIPRNAYQYEQLTRNLWLVVASFGAVAVGLAILRIFLPHTRFMRDLALEAPADEWLERSERLADFEYLADQVGVAATPLMPSGRVKFGEDLIQVVTDGNPVAAGQSVRVIRVMGNRVVVTPLE